MDVRFCGAPFPQIRDPQERDFTVFAYIYLINYKSPKKIISFIFED